MAKLLIKFPTRSRPKQFFETFNLYQQMLSGQHESRFIITIDNDDKTMNNQQVRERLNNYQNTKYYYGNNKTKIQAINANLDLNFEILLLASDDMIPQIQGYDNIIAEDMITNFPDLSGCLHYNDGRQGYKINTLSILGINLYKYFGYIYHPSYQSMYCDNEFMDVTRSMGKAIYIDKTIISHKWIDICGGKKDELYLRNDGPNWKDKINYEKRKAAGFPK